MLHGRSRAETANPLSTIEDIQRRLIRPSSPTPISTVTSSQNHSKVKPMKTLEDYLDPILLSGIRSKVKDRAGRDERVVVNPRLRKSFEWPSDELNSFVDGDDSDSRVAKRNNKKNKWSNGGTVSLNDDLDHIKEEDQEEEEEIQGCSPFGRFEITVSKLFRN